MYNQKNYETMIDLKAKEWFSLPEEFADTYGFKLTRDFLAELKSPIQTPEKQFLQTRIINHLIEIENNKKIINFNLRERLLREQKAIAQIIARHKAHKKLQEKNREFNEEYNQWALENEKKLIEEGVKRHDRIADVKHYAEDLSDSYQMQLDILARIHQEKKEALQNLLNEMSEMELQYNLYEIEYNNIEQRIINENPNLHKIFEQISSPDNLQDLDKALVENTLLNIENRIQKITNLIDQETMNIMNVLDSGDEGKARNMLRSQNAMNIQIGVLHGIKGVLEGTHVFLDSEGNLTNEFQTASFIIDKNQTVENKLNPDGSSIKLTMNDKKLVKDNNSYYLINRHENLKDLDPELKAKAHEDFLKMEPKIRSVKNLIPENKNRSFSFFQERKSQLEQEMQELEKEMKFLQNVQSRTNQIVVNCEKGEMVDLDSMDNPESFGQNLNLTPKNDNIFDVFTRLIEKVTNNLVRKDDKVAIDDKVKPELEEDNQVMQKRMKDGSAAQDESLKEFFAKLGTLIAGQPVPTNKLPRLLEGMNRFTTDAIFDGLQQLTQTEEKREMAADTKAELLQKSKIDGLLDKLAEKLNELQKDNQQDKVMQQTQHMQNEMQQKQENTKESSFNPTPFKTTPKLIDRG